MGNIYIHIELADRELPSKLFLALIASLRGHSVILGDLGSLHKGIRKGWFPPGIFHTKSLTPTPRKLELLKEFKGKGFRITSLDEESGVATELDFTRFVKVRYGRDTLDLASRAFTWGPAETAALVREYPESVEKAVSVGSPRVDLWRPEMASTIAAATPLPSRPFVLVISNFLTNSDRRVHEIVSIDRDLGYLGRPGHSPADYLFRQAEDSKMLAHFVSAIEDLSKVANGWEIVVRPHPGESPEAWKVFLKGLKSVSVIGGGPVTPWILNSIAVIHNGSTTAFESVLLGKPTATFVPFDRDFDFEAANVLGARLTSVSELQNFVARSFESLEDPWIWPGKLESENIVFQRLSNITGVYASEKIVAEWEEVMRNIPTRRQSIPFWRFLPIHELTGSVKDFVQRRKAKSAQQKFPRLDMASVHSLLKQFVKVLESPQVPRLSRVGGTCLQIAPITKTRI